MPIDRPTTNTRSEASRRYATYCRPKLGSLLQMVRLDKTYHRAEGDQMVYRDRRGDEVEITDFLGGYGASIFGHNHPALTETAMEFFAGNRVFNAQSSCRREASRVGEILHDMMAARTGGKAFVTTLANTGTEATESAIKHALMEREQRLDCLRDKLTLEVSRCRRQLEQNGVQLTPETLAIARSRLGLKGTLSPEAVLNALPPYFTEQMSRPPVFLALTRAFHGKTLGSVQLTYDETYRAPFAALGPETVFLNPDDSEALAANVTAHQSSYLIARVEHGRLVLKERFVSMVGGIIVEPIQGEGGIREISGTFLATCRTAANANRFPLIYDEIQSGMGRTGTFLASEHQGVVADYYLLSKSLGGGMAKIAALLVEKSHYVEAFSMIHTSTFAEDDFSAAIAARALTLLEGEPSVYALSQAKGELLRAGLATIAERYPDVIVDVRGRGLMLGVEFQKIAPNDAMVLHMLSSQRLLGYVIAGYLLNEHHIRIAPTLSSTSTLRIEPSAFVSPEAITVFLRAFERVCEILHKRNTFELVKYLVDRPPTPLDTSIENCRSADHAPLGTACNKRVAFIGHFISASDLALTDTSLGQFSNDELARFLRRAYKLFGPVPFPPRLVRSQTGEQTAFHFIGLMMTSKIIGELLEKRQFSFLHDIIHQSVDMAVEQGCTVVGFGGYCSIVTGNCMQVQRDNIACTSGNALTVGMGLSCIYQLAEEKQIDLASAVVAVVGAAGNIGEIYSKRIAGKVKKLILVGRVGSIARLNHLISEIAEQTDAPILETSTDMSAIGEADIIIAMSNASEPIIFPELLKDGPVIINDLSVPLDTDARVFEQRPDVTHIQGGLVQLPQGNQVALEGIPLPPNVLFACMSETILLGLEDMREHYSYGPIRSDQVATISAIANKHGFVLAGPKTERSY